MKKRKNAVLDFSQGTVKVFFFLFLLLYKLTQFNTLNIKLSNYQFTKLKSGTKYSTEVKFH